MDEHDSMDVALLGRRARHLIEVATRGVPIPIVEDGHVVAYLVDPETAAEMERRSGGPGHP